MIAIPLSKQQAPDADPKAIQKINYTGNLTREGNANTTMFFIIEEAKETILEFSEETVKVLRFSRSKWGLLRQLGPGFSKFLTT